MLAHATPMPSELFVRTQLRIFTGCVRTSCLLKKVAGIDVLKAACLPMNIPQGIRLTDNPFNRCWQELEQWAANEELVLSIQVDQDLFFASTVYHLVARPR